MKTHFASVAFLIAGILFVENPVAAVGSGTNRTDSAAGSGSRDGAATNAAVTEEQLRAIQMQRELLDALTTRLNQLLTKYPEKDKRVRATRKQIAIVQKQLASEPAAKLMAVTSGTNRTAKATDSSARASNATTRSTDATAKGGSAAVNTNTNAPTNTALLKSAAASGGSNSIAKATDATTRIANSSAKDKSTKAAEARAEATPTITSGTNATASTNVSVKLVSMETLDDKHRLAIGDKLSFRIEEDKYRLAPAREDQNERSKDDPTPLLVTDSGELEVPYIGRFPAENKTCKQLAYELKAALEKDYFYKATVILALDLKAKTLGRVYLTGAVHEPGPEEIPSDEVLTLGKAILRAGGFTDFAERHNVKVTRTTAGSSQTKTLVVDVAQVFDKGKTELDLPLEPGDLILVPERLVRF